MKVDKDAILKQKFWILLGVFALLWLVCLSVLYANASGPLDKAKDDYKKANDAITQFTGVKRPKNDSFLPPWKKHGERFEEHKKTVWKVAWDGDKVADGDSTASGLRWEGQKGIYTWPSSNEFNLQAELLYPDSAKSEGKPAFDVDARQWYKTKEAYASQFDKLYTELKGDRERPTLDAPLGAVDFKGGFDAVMQPVDWEKSTRPPDIEECWLAQEDFWVKRELLYTVRDALSMAARLDPVDVEFEKTPVPAGKLGRHVFRNPSWEVTLLFDKTDNGTRISPDSTIKNVHVSHRDQDLGSPKNPTGVWFRLFQDGNPVRAFPVEGEKVAWQQSRTFGAGKAKDGFLVNADPARPMQLEQVFDSSNTPIVVVDELKIPYLSHRNAIWPLIPTKPDRYGKHDSPADASKAPVPGAPGLPTAGNMTPGMPPAGSGPLTGLPGASGQTAEDLTSNKTLNIHRNRYLFVTEQSRHLPLAMTLTIDQSHLGDILVAVANSRLRFQTTQVEFRRDHSGGPAGSSTPAGDRPPGTAFPAGSSGGLPPAPPPMPMTGPGFPSGAPAAPTAVDEGNPNLVEVTIYGIASLYERPRAE